MFPAPLSPAYRLSVLSRVGRGGAEVLLLTASLLAAFQIAPPVVQAIYPLSEIAMSLPILGCTIALYAAGAALLSRTFLALPPAAAPSARSRVGHRPVLVAAVWCVTLSSLLSIALLALLGQESREEPLLLELCMSAWRHPSHALQIALLGPVVEETLFRGLLFARLARGTGVTASYLISGGLFGALHWGADSSKVVDTVACGWLMGAAYRSSLSLLAPILAHTLHNGLALAAFAALTPLQSDASLQRALAVFFAMNGASERCILAVKRALGVPVGRDEWTGQEGEERRHRVVQALFAVLDRGGKGFLSAEEAAFFFTLNTDVLDHVGASLLVIRSDGTQQDCSSIVDSASPAPATARLTCRLPLPAPDFLAARSPRQDSSIVSLYDAFTSQPLATYDPAVLAPSSALTRLAPARFGAAVSSPLAPSSAPSSPLPHIAPHQTRLMRHFYDVFMSSYCQRALGMAREEQSPEPAAGLRLTADEFEQLCKRLSVLMPGRLLEMGRRCTMIAMGVMRHPLAVVRMEMDECDRAAAAATAAH